MFSLWMYHEFLVVILRNLIRLLIYPNFVYPKFVLLNNQSSHISAESVADIILVGILRKDFVRTKSLACKRSMILLHFKKRYRKNIGSNNLNRECNLLILKRVITTS